MKFKFRAVVFLFGLEILQLILSTGGFAATGVPYSYTPYRFAAAEQWQVRSRGPMGNSSWGGKKLVLDFAKGAEWISLVPPDRCLLGNVQLFRLKVRGNTAGHSLHLFVNTHFMTFHKVLGELREAGEQTLEIQAPPGTGWKWFEGENDGKRHGPLRIGEIRFESKERKNRCELEMVSLAVEGSVPANKRVLLTARGSKNSIDPSFHVEVQSLAEDSMAGTLHWIFRDWVGKDLDQGSRSVRIPSHAEKLKLDVQAPGFDRPTKFIEAEISLTVPNQNIPGVRPCWLAPPYRHQDNSLNPDSPFGMGIYLCRYKEAEMEEVARMASEAGVKWSREDFEWHEIEPRPGEYHWDYYDHLLEVAKRNGITVYAIVAYFPEWSKGFTEEGVRQYVKFLEQLINRYKADIHYWEIWNEPNIFFWQGPKELYAELLRQSFKAVRERDPSARVLGISTSGIDYSFIEKMLALKTPFDILTIHPYRTILEDNVFIHDLKRAFDLVKLPDGSTRPVWLTEMGWATHTPHNTADQDFQPVTLRMQAELIARSYLCSIVSGIEPRTFWYDFRDDGDDPFYFEHTLGILYRDFQPKPAYAAYSTLAQVLKNKRLDGPLEEPAGTFAYRFVNPREASQVTIAVWNPVSDTTLQLTVPNGQYVCVNAIGEERAAKLALSGQSRLEQILTLDLKKGAPLYLVRK